LLAGNTSLWLAKAVAYRRGFFPLLAGVAPEFAEIKFSDEDALHAFVSDRNERRNITAGQKAILFPDRRAWGLRRPKGFLPPCFRKPVPSANMRQNWRSRSATDFRSTRRST
jgi:hypothetical protein